MDIRTRFTSLFLILLIITATQTGEFCLKPRKWFDQEKNMLRLLYK